MIEGGDLHSGPTPRGGGASAAATTKVATEVSQILAENALITDNELGLSRQRWTRVVKISD